jgi:pimeloyl-ACP methyl ester carboxylesterase
VEELVRSARGADGCVLRYRIAGEGPPVVFLHGTLSSPSTFRQLHPFLESGGHFTGARGADHRRLISPIMRGHDGEAPPSLPDDYSIISTEVSDLRAVLDAEGIGRFDLVGHSTGGTTAVGLALAEPDRVGRMVLIEPTLLSLLDGPMRERVHGDLATIIEAGAAGDHLSALDGLLDFVSSGPEPPAVRQRVVERLGSRACLVAPHVKALSEFELDAAEVRALRPRILFVYGGASAYWEASIAARLAQLRPDLPQLQVPGAGHHSHVEQPAMVGPAMAKHLYGEGS